MPRGARDVDAVVLEAISPIVAQAAERIARMVANAVSARVEVEVRKRTERTRRRGAGSRRSARAEMTRWVADNRARRVPNFVKEGTGLDTKKKIVAKFGEDAVFQKGKPLPPVAEKSTSAEPKPEVKAKPPTVRRKGKAAA